MPKDPFGFIVTVLIKVINYPLLASDKVWVSLLVLLDLYASCDHSTTLLDRLENVVGVVVDCYQLLGKLY